MNEAQCRVLYLNHFGIIWQGTCHSLCHTATRHTGCRTTVLCLTYVARPNPDLPIQIESTDAHALMLMLSGYPPDRRLHHHQARRL